MFKDPAYARPLFLTMAVCLSLAACSGQVTSNGQGRGSNDSPDDGSGGGGGSDTPGTGGVDGEGSPKSFVCDQSKTWQDAPLRKLTAPQIKNTLSDVVRYSLPKSGAEVMQAVDRQLALVPIELRPQIADEPHGTFRRLAQDITQQGVDAWLDVAMAVASEATTALRLPELVGACATDTDKANDDACLRTFVAKFGARVQRRPLAKEDLDSYVAVAGASPITAKGIANVVATILISPRMMYLVEQGKDAVAGVQGRYALDDWELASRLSYQAWDAPPDDSLLEAARAGGLSNPDQWKAAVNRVTSDARAKKTMEKFFEEWWHLDELPDAAGLSNEKAYKSFAGGDLPDATWKPAAVRDVLEFVNYIRSGGDGGRLSDLFRSNAVFPSTDALAKIYGVSTWSSGEPRRAPGRDGLLTRPALLYRANPAGRTNPIMKGVFIRRSILCDEIPPPPANALAERAKTDTSKATTERQIAAVLTEAPGTSCAACHTYLINPLGFVTEGFDALGRARTMERRFDVSSGSVISTTAVDTKVAPRVTPDDDREVSDAKGLADLLEESGKPAACLAKQYFRYTFARVEDEEKDGCTLEKIRSAAGDSMDDSLKAILLSNAFREKNIGIAAGGKQ